MHNIVWLILSITIGFVFSFLSGGLFSADYSSFWPAIGSIGTLGAWYFLYQQSKATNEQIQITQMQLRSSQIATYRAEIKLSVDQVVEYLFDGENIKFDRLSWINASLEVENISLLISLLPETLHKVDTERFGRLLDSKLPSDLFESDTGGASLLNNEMVKVHKKGKGRFERCEEFAGQEYLLSVYMFTRQYEFRTPKEIEDFKFRRKCFFHTEEIPKFKCQHCSNVL